MEGYININVLFYSILLLPVYMFYKISNLNTKQTKRKGRGGAIFFNKKLRQSFRAKHEKQLRPTSREKKIGMKFVSSKFCHF